MIKCDIKFGYTCNNKCVHCVIADERRTLEKQGQATDLTTAEWKDTLDSYKRIGADYIVLTGGEVTERKDFADIVAYCRNLDYSIGLQSNGRAFAYPDTCKAIENIERIYCTVAIHGSTPHIHDAITRAPGSFAETVAGLRNLRSMAITVTAKIVISNYNKNDLLNILELLQSVGVTQANFTFPHALGNARLNFKKVVPRYHELKPVLKQLVEKGNALGVGIEFEAIPFCIVPEHPECVTEIYDLDNIHRLFKPVASTTLDWNKIRPTIKKRGKRCDLCLYSHFCEGCWSEYIKRFGDKEFEPVTEVSEATYRLISAISTATSVTG